MKKILFQKLFTDYMIFLLLALISTSIVIWVFQAVNYLDIMIEDGRDLWVYINFSLLNFPKIVSKIFPFVLFFSLFYVTTKYELNNELIIFWNFGVHKIQIVNFVLKFSLFLLFVQLVLTSIIVPKAQDQARYFLRSSTVNFLDNFIKPQKFNDTIKDVTIYSDKKDKEGNLYNLYLKKRIGSHEFQITYARKGVFKENGNKPVLILYDGATISSKNKNITNISFSKSDFSLANLETNTTTYKKTQEISSSKIIKCIYYFYNLGNVQFKMNSKNIENCSEKNMKNILKEFYKRFIIPLYLPILSLLSMILIIQSKENSNYNRIRLITFVFGISTIIFSETTIRFVDQARINNLSLILIPIIFLLTIYFVLFYKFKINPKNYN